MKRLAVVSLFAFACSAVFGAANDTLISFSTPGPDKYADGTTVLDGECYALVWTKTGKTFEGLSADGAAVGSDSSVLVYAPVAKGGRCPTVVFELDAALATNYTGGAFGVYALDTRLANGKVGGLDAAGKPVAVNGYGAANDGSGVSCSGGSGISSLAGSGGVSAATRSTAPADAPRPKITAFKVVGGNVHLTVKGTLPCLQYVAREVDVGNAAVSDAVSSPAQGAASAEEEITLIVPAKGGSGFFQVGRK